MPYTEFLALIANARGVISDGGSNQEELSYLGVPTILFRARSERPDGIGENAVLYSPAMSPLDEFVRSNKLDALRKPTKLDAESRPSQISLDAIARWAALEGERDTDPIPGC
jgi:UDP-N-acetylglucosamine 2-epimerase (non-hydrolysing)